jgi:PII-like signaling protein
MTSQAKLLLVVVGEAHMHGEIPLFEYIVRRLRQLEVAGATAVRGELGFGHRESAHRGDPFEFPSDRPVVVFAVDTAERIEQVVPEIRALLVDGIVTVLDAERIARG